MLEGKAGKNVQLSIYNPQNGKRFPVTIKPISTGEQNELLYKRWVKKMKRWSKLFPEDELHTYT